MFTYLPHRDLLVAEKEKVDVSGHVRWLLHEHIVVEEVLDAWDLTNRLQLLTVRLHFILAILRRVNSLIVPELPLSLHRVSCAGLH